jgi:tRNA threonylcarbamoyladenosine modification (KEOPS) complex  Pcc1 subunit
MNYSLDYRLFVIFLTFFVLGLLTPSGVIAAEKNDKSAKRAAILMQKMQQDMQAQFEQEKSAMKAQFDQEKKQLEEKIEVQQDTIRKLGAVEGKVRNLEAEQRKISAEKSSIDTKQQQTQSQLEVSAKALADLKAQYNQVLAELKSNESQRKAQLVNLSQTNKALKTCEEKNEKLYTFGNELIHIYEAPNGLAHLKNKPEFFKSKEVEMENILQNQKDKIEAEHLSAIY